MGYGVFNPRNAKQTRAKGAATHSSDVSRQFQRWFGRNMAVAPLNELESLVRTIEGQPGLADHFRAQQLLTNAKAALAARATA